MGRNMGSNGHIDIDGRKIGKGAKAYIIAEVAQAHDGSLGYAHSFIDAAADSGADAIKFQTHIAKAESTRDETFRVPLSGQDATRYEYWQRMEFTPEGWAALFNHAKARNITFLSSVFSCEAVELLEKLGMAAYKVGSGEVWSADLLKSIAKTRKPILLSTGMSSFAEIDAMVESITAQGSELGIFQCTSEYPVALERVGLNICDEFRSRYTCPVGLSDHSGTIFPALAAMARGVDMIEVHVTYDRRMYGPDTKASVTFAELEMLTRARDAFHTMITHPVDKDAMVIDMAQMRKLFTKSVALKVDMPKGTVLTADMLCAKKPGMGIPYDEKSKLIGKKLVRDLPYDRLLRLEDIED